MGLYNADDPDTLAAIAESYSGDAEAYKHDHVTRCIHCLVLFDHREDEMADLFDREILDSSGDYVCTGCADDFLEQQAEPHGEPSHFVRNGSMI